MSHFLIDGRKVRSFHFASSGSYRAEEGMSLVWESVTTDADGWEIHIEPFIHWEGDDGVTNIVSLRHVEHVALEPLKEKP